MSWSIKTFEQLNPQELYSILQIRNAVFIVEQNCPYQDVDNKDLSAIHIFYQKEGNIVAYCRIMPAGLSYPEISIGRVLTVKSVRTQGLGKVLMEKAMQFIKEQWPKQNVRISAQEYLKEFYSSFGFKTIGSSYLEDDIPHIAMILDLSISFK